MIDVQYSFRQRESWAATNVSDIVDRVSPLVGHARASGDLLVWVLHLVVCGIRTEQCCETTARLASDLGYRVAFVVDATATTPIEHPDAAPGRTLAQVLADPLTLTADEIVRRAVYALAH